MNIKQYFLWVGVIVVLLVLLVGSLALRNKYTPQTKSPATNLHGFYTIENQDFGYKFNMSDEYFQGYQEQKAGYTTTYYIPRKDLPSGYTPVFNVIATPKELAKKFTALCAANRQTAPIQCTDYTQSDAENNLFYFNIREDQDSELLAGTYEFPNVGPEEAQKDIALMENIMAEVKKNITAFDVNTLPQTLPYQNFTSGYEFNYPAEFDRSFEESMMLNLPQQLEKDGLGITYYPVMANVLPIKYCALSGQCENTTTNFVVNIIDAWMTESELTNSPLGPSLTKTTIAGQKVYLYNEGAEGEGIDYYFVVSPISNYVVTVAHKYIDESVITTYLTAKNFIKYEQQKRIILKLIDSIEFHQPWLKISN